MRHPTFTTQAGMALALSDVCLNGLAQGIHWDGTRYEPKSVPMIIIQFTTRAAYLKRLSIDSYRWVSPLARRLVGEPGMGD